MRTATSDVVAHNAGNAPNAGESGAVLADSPTAFYSLGDAGPTAVDASGHNYNGTYGSDLSHAVPGLTTQSADLACTRNGNPGGTQSIVTVPAGAALQPTSAVTVEAWIKPAMSNLAQYMAVVSYGNAVIAPYDNYKLELTPPNRFGFQVLVGNRYHKIVSNASFSAGSVYHVVGTYDGTTERLYVNGNLDVQSSGAQGPIVGYHTSTLYLGGDSSNSKEYVGTLDDVAIYGSALPNARVAAHYAAGTAGPSASPAPFPTGSPPTPGGASFTHVIVDPKSYRDGRKP